MEGDSEVVFNLIDNVKENIFVGLREKAIRQLPEDKCPMGKLAKRIQPLP